MRTHFIVGVTALAFFALAMTVVSQRSSASSDNNAPKVEGVWWYQFDLGGGAIVPAPIVPAVCTVNQDGTGVCTDFQMFGSYPDLSRRFGPLHVVWEKTGGHSFGFTSLMLISRVVPNQPGAVLSSIVRARTKMEFSGDSDHMKGVTFTEYSECAAPPFGCPNPNDRNTVWTNSAPPNGFPTTAERFEMVPLR